MSLYVRGIDPDILGSPRDQVLRSFLSKERKIESMRLMAQTTSSLGLGKEASDLLKKSINAIWYIDESAVDISTETKYREMQEYYHNHIRTLAPELKKVKDERGRVIGLEVSGLEGLTTNV